MHSATAQAPANTIATRADKGSIDMGAFSLATGVSLLYDEGVLPPNAARQALAFASPAENSRLGSDGLALKRTATVLAMEDHLPDGTVLLSPTAMEFLVAHLESHDPAAQKANAIEPPKSSGYPYGGWSSSSPTETNITAEPTGSTAVSTTHINLLG